MQVPISWLEEYVDLVLPLEELAERLTLAGLAVDAIEKVGDWWDPEFIRVGQIVAVSPHPDADRLTLVDIDFGESETERVVTGAPNIFQYKGMNVADGTLPVIKAPFARSGATLLDAYSEETPRPFKKLKPSKIRGVLSNGMVCSERELGLSEEHEGILLLPENAPVGAPLRDYLGDSILELDLTPDMARALSIAGVAREVSALTGGALHLPPDIVETGGGKEASAWVDVEIEDADLCNRYTGMIIENVKIGSSPRWMRERLERAGMRPVNNVVDITNYVMLALGQPLHAFDYDVLRSRAQGVEAETGATKPVIVVKRALAGEKFTTLDHVERTLDGDMLMICDRAGSIALAGVMGGLESEISDSTTNILLESATFHSINTRRTSQKLKLPSEASYRFARGVPATLNPIAARYAAELMRLYANGTVAPGIVDAYPVPQARRVVYTTQTDTARLLGMKVSLDEIADSLKRLDFTVTVVADPDDTEGANGNGDSTYALARATGEPLVAAIAPWHRLDVRIPADLTEEIARVIGYEHVETSLLNEPLPTQRRNTEYETEDRIRDLLVGSAMQEVINYALTSPESHDKLAPGLDPLPLDKYVGLANAIAPERRVMRRTLLVSQLENLARNARSTPRHAYFEIGRVYRPEEGDGVLPGEDRRLSLLMAGVRHKPDFYDQGDESFDFFDIKGVIESLVQRLGFAPQELEFRAKPDAPPFGPRCAEMTLAGKSLGIVGEIHPRVRDAFDIPSNLRVCAAEMHIAALLRPTFSLSVMRPISNYPAMVEDLAFEVDEEVTVRRLEDLIRKTGGFLLVEVELFDIYRGQNIAAGRKSIAFHLTYQSPDRALNEKEVNAIRQRIIATVQKETGGLLRG